MKKNVQEHRQRKRKAQEHTANVPVQGTSDQEQCPEITSSSDTAMATPLIVKLPLLDTKKRTRKRVSRAVSKCKRQIERLKRENEKSNRKFKTMSKRFERLSHKMSKNKDTQTKSNTIVVRAEVHQEKEEDCAPSHSKTEAI